MGERDMKILIIGGPRTGKTTRALEQAKTLETLGTPHTLVHTDDIAARLPWSMVSDEVFELLQRPGDWIIEGVAGVRGLRKYLKAGLVPDFEVIWMGTPYAQEKKHHAMHAQALSIWRECQGMIELNRVNLTKIKS